MAGLTDREAGAVLQRLDDQDKRFDTQDILLREILDQTRKTNGRVRALEISRAKLTGVFSVAVFAIPLAVDYVVR